MDIVLKLKIEPSRFNGNCDITLQFRRVCSTCRHAKCLAIGMSRDLIRKEDLNERSLCSTIKIKQKQNIIEQTRMRSKNEQTFDAIDI
ncbi:unnamed protein product [Rotaria magnacalcarata]|uniref:Nuclear receptor domain-containing protein n=1 Tax=Rotaria magnacalcarata TaxID=392030 RepID=A0A819R473_9BILA|nr:unnamed protein product [Rotaria magnacalcarata]